ncbi:MAG: hypothetical protein PHU51_04165 [Candidatus Nanoarchaeia archaeon]|nr:hypothetical protein [Candidatus Nanoarchaeia archaeon]
MTYDELLKKSEEINELIHEHTNNSNLENCSLEPQKIDDYKIDDLILIFGINPSSSDIDKGKEKADCFLMYVDSDENIAEECKKQGWTYPSYFKNNYELVKPLDYRMFWEIPRFLESKKDILKENFNVLSSIRKSNGKYVLFADLVYYKETKAHKIKDIIDKEKLKEKIFDFFKMQLEYYKPKGVIITNAFASKLVYEMNHGNLDYTSDDSVKGIPVIYSSMVSGQRALDDFNYLRLKKDIEAKLK